jgi:hypothetical protein
MLVPSPTSRNLKINPPVVRHQEQVDITPIAMSTCVGSCQESSCASSADSSQDKLTLILNVLDLLNGFLGVLIAVLVGYLQARQFRRFNQAMDGSIDDEKASQQLFEHAAKCPEPV